MQFQPLGDGGDGNPQLVATVGIRGLGLSLLAADQITHQRATANSLIHGQAAHRRHRHQRGAGTC